MKDNPGIERLCMVMHDAYEAAAAESGWETQVQSRVPWRDVPEANKEAMRAAVRTLLDELRARDERIIRVVALWHMGPEFHFSDRAIDAIIAAAEADQ